MATHLVFLPGEPHGQRSLAGYNPEGCKELDTTEVTYPPHTVIKVLQREGKAEDM